MTTPTPPLPAPARTWCGGCRLPCPRRPVYGYARVSTIQQADEGESLDVQQRVIAGYAPMQGLRSTRCSSSVASRDPSRSATAAGSALLAVLQPGDAVITPKLDRMFRSALDALEVLGRLKQAGVALHMIDLGGDTTGNGVSKLVFTILSAVAEAERDRTRERISEVKRDQRQRGRYLGGKAPGAGVSARPASWSRPRATGGDPADAEAAGPGPRAASDCRHDEGRGGVDQPCRGEERPRRGRSGIRPIAPRVADRHQSCRGRPSPP